MDLIMPFITVKSKDGPFDDQSYAAGWAMAKLDSQLEFQEGNGYAIVRELDIPQADLVGMRNGFTLESNDLEDAPGWSHCTFIRMDDDGLSNEDS